MAKRVRDDGGGCRNRSSGNFSILRLQIQRRISQVNVPHPPLSFGLFLWEFPSFVLLVHMPTLHAEGFLGATAAFPRNREQFAKIIILNVAHKLLELLGIDDVLPLSRLGLLRDERDGVLLDMPHLGCPGEARWTGHAPFFVPDAHVERDARNDLTWWGFNSETRAEKDLASSGNPGTPGSVLVPAIGLQGAFRLRNRSGTDP